MNDAQKTAPTVNDDADLVSPEQAEATRREHGSELKSLWKAAEDTAIQIANLRGIPGTTIAFHGSDTDYDLQHHFDSDIFQCTAADGAQQEVSSEDADTPAEVDLWRLLEQQLVALSDETPKQESGRTTIASVEELSMTYEDWFLFAEDDGEALEYDEDNGGYRTNVEGLYL